MKSRNGKKPTMAHYAMTALAVFAIVVGGESLFTKSDAVAEEDIIVLDEGTGLDEDDPPIVVIDEPSKELSGVEEDLVDSSAIGGLTAQGEIQPKAAPSVKYRAHVQDIGWMSWVNNGGTAGTEGRALQVEAFTIETSGLTSGSMRYQAHVMDIGWQGWKRPGEVSGTVGQARRVEALRIELTGAAASNYDVVYRVHVPNLGWLAWAKNGQTAGSEGMGLRVEAVQVKLVAKGTVKTGMAALAKPKLSVQAHSANVGWQSEVGEGTTAGTTGRALKLEALRLVLPGFDGAGSAISARAHVSDIGWMNWTASGGVTGTTGKGKAMEAVQIKLTGSVASFFDVYYRAHVRDHGWLGWAKNGESAGSSGMALPMEAIEVKILVKDTPFYRGSSAFLQPKPVQQTSAYDAAVNGFLSDSRWRNGASWSSGQRPKISGAGAQGCCAYAADFIKYVFGANSFGAGQSFYDPSAIRAGDVIKVVNGQHWFVVLGRNGNSLWTAEGNWGGKVVVSNGTYTISGKTLYRNGSKFRTFSVGYHMQ